MCRYTLRETTTDTISLLSSFYAVLFPWYCMLVLLLRVWMDFLIFYHASIPPAPYCLKSELAYSYRIWYTFGKLPYCKKKKRRTVIMRKPCDLWAEPAQRLQAQKIICSRHGASVLADDKDLQPMGGARIHSSAEELVFKRRLKTSTSTNNHKEYERLHGPHSQCGEF